METLKQHPFEKTLGAGPYKYLGMTTIIKPCDAMPEGNYRQLVEVTPTKFVRGMGTCAHCNHAIMNVFFVQVGNGEVYGVGCDCILKVGMEPAEIKKVERDERNLLKEQRRVRKENKVVNARAELDVLLYGSREKMCALPHPRGFSNCTLLDYALWVRDHVSNPASAVKTIKTALGVK